MRCILQSSDTSTLSTLFKRIEDSIPVINISIPILTTATDFNYGAVCKDISGSQQKYSLLSAIINFHVSSKGVIWGSGRVLQIGSRLYELPARFWKRSAYHCGLGLGAWTPLESPPCDLLDSTFSEVQ